MNAHDTAMDAAAIMHAERSLDVARERVEAAPDDRERGAAIEALDAAEQRFERIKSSWVTRAEPTPQAPPIHPCAACPRYQSCGANICPLDPDWRKRSHLEHEPVCGLLRELVKPDGRATLASTLPADLVTVIADALPEVTASNFDIRAQLARSAKTGSRIRGAGRLRAIVDARKHPDQGGRAAAPCPAPSSRAHAAGRGV